MLTLSLGVFAYYCCTDYRHCEEYLFSGAARRRPPRKHLEGGRLASKLQILLADCKPRTTCHHLLSLALCKSPQPHSCSKPQLLLKCFHPRYACRPSALMLPTCGRTRSCMHIPIHVHVHTHAHTCARTHTSTHCARKQCVACVAMCVCALASACT